MKVAYTRVSAQEEPTEVELPSQAPREPFRWRNRVLTTCAVVFCLILVYLGVFQKELSHSVSSAAAVNKTGSSERAEPDAHVARQRGEKLHSGVALPKNKSALSLHELFADNLQGRPGFGRGRLSDGFVRLNRARAAKRRRDMRELDMIRVRYCGHTVGGRWKVLQDEQEVVYFNDTFSYAQGRRGRRPPSRVYKTRRRMCEESHPRLANTRVRIERLGPFRSSGNYDWTVVFGWKNAGCMANVLKDRVVYVRGRMFAPVYANGTLVNYPPLHIHHAHILPYAHKKLSKKIMPSGGRGFWRETIGNHHVLVQAHGDTICQDDEGGLDCLLDQLNDDKGYRIDQSTGFPADFEINDARIGVALADLEYYVDLAFIYTEERLKPVTFMQMGNPAIGYGWQTYMFPLEPHTNLMYYNYTNTLLGDGTMDNFIMHTHMTTVDSIYVYKGRAVYGALEEYRRKRNGALPFIFECHDIDPQKGKESVLRLVEGEELDSLIDGRLKVDVGLDESKLVCEATKPALKLECEGSLCTYRDKRISFNCRQSVPLKAGESLVILAFNKVRNVSTTPLTRTSSQEDLAVFSPFGMGYAVHQHSFFRADFTSATLSSAKDWNISYAPPALFVYGDMPYHARNVMQGARRILEGCPDRFSYVVDLPWNKRGLP